MSHILAAGAARMKLEAENYEARIVALEAQLAEARAIANLTIEAAPPATCAHQIWGQDLDGTRTCARCGLTTSPAPKATGFWAGNPGIIPIGEEVIILAVDFTDPDTRKACWVRWWPKIREYPIYLSCDLSDINRDGEALASTGAVKETDVMVCPQCEGEGSYADGLDDAACTTPCTRCESNGWIVNLASHPRDTNTVDAHEAANVSDKPEGQQEPVAYDAGIVAVLLDASMKQDEIAVGSIKRAARVQELVHWFARLAQDEANPKWTRSHASELAYYIATTSTRPSEQAVTEAMVEAAADEIVNTAEIDFNGIIINRTCVARSALKAAMEAGHD